MASLSQLQSDVALWLNRRDIDALVPSWIAMCENDIAQLLRVKVMVAQGEQPVDAPRITMPANYLEMEVIRDQASGQLLKLEDHFTGPPRGRIGPCTAYRAVGQCIEFLPWPVAPPPPDTWTPQVVEMVWYARPQPLLQPADTNPVLESHYQVYLFGTVLYGAIYELDDPRAQQMQGKFQEAIQFANTAKQMSDYSGAPLRAVVRGF